MTKIKYECIWNPSKDITTYELAQCLMLVFSRFHEVEDWDKLDENITRHFSVALFDYGKMINDSAERMKELL